MSAQANPGKPIPAPSPQQMAWQDMEMGIFFHFGLNTFNGREWGDGTDSPETFNPSAFDARQWASAARKAGFRYAVLTAKHHDGFCLWPTATTDYSIRSSPWRKGQGDVVRECAEACREEGLRFGVYLSPWDRHEPCYGDEAAYDDFYARQLEELLTGYGPLAEVWFDGAGSEGRKYDWPLIMALVKQHQPDAMIFNMGQPTIRWVGNEDGLAPYPCWNEAESARISMFTEAMPDWLPGTPAWLPAECDVPIRKPHWFWQPNEEHLLLSLEELMEVYYRSVGHGAGLLLNVAPDRRGLLPEADVSRLLEFGTEISRRFSSPLADTAGAGALLELAVDGSGSQWVDHVILMEDIAHGERILEYKLEAWQAGEWVLLANGTAVGHKKIDRFPAVNTGCIRLSVTKWRDSPMIRSFAAYRAEASAF